MQADNGESSNDRHEEPEKKERSKLLTVCPYILGNEFGERLAYYGLATNLVNYFKQIGAASDTAAFSVNLFSGFCYGLAPLGGWIADSRLGRFKTILIFSIVYLIGMLSLAGSAAIPGIRVEDEKDANPGQWTLVVFCLSLVTLGASGIKPNVSTFGADQFDETKPQDRAEKTSFFFWFYFFINVGAMLATVVIVPIQDQDMWDIGFGIPGLALLVAVVLFYIGKPLYSMLPPTGSALARFFSVTGAALRNKRKSRASHAIAQSGADPDANAAPLIQHSSSRREHWLDWAVGPGPHTLSHSFLTDGVEDFTAEQVYEVKLVYGVVWVFYTSVIYWLVYVQMSTMFVLQGNQLEREVKIFGSSRRMPSASMSLFNTLAIILFIPVFDLLIIPSLKKYLNYTPTLLQRVGAGYFLALLAMVSAYLIERKRLDAFHNGEYFEKEDDGDIVEVVRLSIWWQIIPYSLIGASEVLASIGLMEFFYNQAPDSMRSMMSALNLIGTALGSWLSASLVKGLNRIAKAAGDEWISDNLNDGHLDYFFLLIAALMLMTCVWFLYIAMHYKYKVIAHAQVGEEADPQRLAENLGRSIAYHGEDLRTTERL